LCLSLMMPAQSVFLAIFPVAFLFCHIIFFCC
jgi:hypothetical protein